MKYEIYIITNTVNAKQYVGITKRLRDRWAEHKRAQTNSALHLAIKKYGKEKFVMTHIATAFDEESAQKIESMLIVDYNTKAPNGYNMTDGGEGVLNLDEESRTKMISALVERNKSQKQKDAVRASKHGYKQSDELIKKRTEPLKGRKHSSEEIAKRVATRKANNKPSPIIGNKWNVGRKLSPESIAKRTATAAINRAKKLAEKELA
jgi:group I intron endonuclease